MQKKGKNVGLFSALVIALLSLGGFVGAAAMVASNQGTLVFMASADEDEGGDSGDDEKDSEKDDEKDDDSDKEKKEKEKEKKYEETKKQTERERETERERSSGNGSETEDEDTSDDEEDVDENGSDELDEDEESVDNGMYRDRNKTMLKLAERLAEAEKEILEKQSEGADVTAALARLAQAKQVALSVGSAFDANNLEAAKDLSKEVKKLTHFAVEEDLHDAKKAAEDSAKTAKRLAQVERKIAAYEGLGGDGAAFRAMLAKVSASFAEAKQLVAEGGTGLISGLEKLETVEEQAKNIKDSIEQATFALGGGDDDFDDEHEDEIGEIADDLDDVADIEDDSVGQQIRMVAREQRQSATRVAESVRSTEGRGALTEFLVGSKSDAIEDIRDEIAMNAARIAVLTRAAEGITDPEVKSMLEERIVELQAETAQLQGFVDAKLDKNGIFGWLFSIFGGA